MGKLQRSGTQHGTASLFNRKQLSPPFPKRGPKKREGPEKSISVRTGMLWREGSGAKAGRNSPATSDWTAPD